MMMKSMVRKAAVVGGWVGCLALTALLAGWSQTLWGQEFSTAEKKELQRLQDKKPPKESLAEYQELHNANEQLKKELKERKERSDQLRKVEITALEFDIGFLKDQANRYKTVRESTLEGIVNTRDSIREFNERLYNFLSVNIDQKSYVLLGLPVFKRREVFKPSPKDGLTLLVNDDRAVTKRMLPIGGELLCTDTGRAQFVIVTRKDGECRVRSVGEPLEITLADTVGTGVYKKAIVFTENFKEMDPGDCIGVIVDNRMGITYDNLGTSRTSMVEMEAVPGEEDEVSVNLAPMDTLRTLIGNDGEVWQEFVKPQDAGQAFSFNMLGRLTE